MCVASINVYQARCLEAEEDAEAKDRQHARLLEGAEAKQQESNRGLGRDHDKYLTFSL